MSDRPITPDSGVPVVQLPTALDVWAHQPFQSRSEEREAFASPRYSDPGDAAYRAAIEHKLSLTPPYEGQPQTYIGGGAMSSRGPLMHHEIRMTEADRQEIESLAAERQREEARQQAVAYNERLLAQAITIPDLKTIDPTTPAVPFRDREEMLKFMSVRDEKGSRYANDPTYRAWVMNRIAVSPF
jgi:hypothetical protein